MPDLVLILRYRKAVTYGFHVLLGALETHETPTSYEVRFAETADATAAAIKEALGTARRVLVLWSFYSPDAAALAVELASIKAAAPGAVHQRVPVVRHRPERAGVQRAGPGVAVLPR